MKEEINSYLDTNCLGNNIIYMECVDSTNEHAKMIGKNGGVNGTIVIAERQTNGRGRRGRSWSSPEGNCYFSILLRPKIQTEYASRLTLVAALAVAKAVRRITGLKTQIKWPNDVIVNSKKICGILTESSTGYDGLEYVVIGIGINVNQRMFDAEIETMATSIFQEKHEECNRAELIACFVNCFEEYYEDFVQTQELSFLLDEYNNLLINKGKEIRILDENESIYLAGGINEAGELIIYDKYNNMKTVLAGEVSVRGLYEYV